MQNASRSLLRLATHLAAAVALAPGRLPAQAEVHDSAGARCEETGTWSAAMPLRLPNGHPVYIDAGSAEFHPSGALALGSPIGVWEHPEAVLPSESESASPDTMELLLAWTLSGLVVRPDGGLEPLGLPAAGAGVRMLAPSIRRGPSGGYHVVWAEDTTGGYDPDRLWYARFDSAGAGAGARSQWTSPVLIAESGEFRWNGQSTNQLAERGDSLVLAAVNTSDHSVLVARGIGGEWRTAKYLDRDSWAASYVAAGLSARGMPLLVVSGVIEGQNALFAVELAAWEPQGGTWHPPVLLNTAGAYSAGESRLAHLGGDSLLLVWERRAVEGGATLGLRAMVSPDGGAEWHDAGDVPLSGGLRGLRLLVDHRGGIHAIYVGSPSAKVLDEPAAVQHLRWRDGEWSASVTASPRPSFGRPVAAVTPDGIMAIWGEHRLVEDGHVPRSYAAWWRDGCIARP